MAKLNQTGGDRCDISRIQQVNRQDSSLPVTESKYFESTADARACNLETILFLSKICWLPDDVLCIMLSNMTNHRTFPLRVCVYRMLT